MKRKSDAPSRKSISSGSLNCAINFDAPRQFSAKLLAQQEIDHGIASEHFPLTDSVWEEIRQRGRNLAQRVKKGKGLNECPDQCLDAGRPGTTTKSRTAATIKDTTKES